MTLGLYLMWNKKAKEDDDFFVVLFLFSLLTLIIDSIVAYELILKLCKA